MNALSSLLLLVMTAVIGLGLAAVATGLMPAAGVDHGVQVWSPVSRVRSLALEAERRETEVALRQALGSPGASTGERASAARPHVSAAGPWTSPLYPQNGVTLWDRIRVSSQKDRRAFLMGTAIQIHTPALAATPGTRPY
jgi:hypothetical protein